MNLSLEGLALGYGILTCDNYEQALLRSTSSKSMTGKGMVATKACISQIKLKRKYTYES